MPCLKQFAAAFLPTLELGRVELGGLGGVELGRMELGRVDGVELGTVGRVEFGRVDWQS